jgi:hypothetical protein
MLMAWAMAKVMRKIRLEAAPADATSGTISRMTPTTAAVTRIAQAGAP